MRLVVALVALAGAAAAAGGAPRVTVNEPHHAGRILYADSPHPQPVPVSVTLSDFSIPAQGFFRLSLSRLRSTSVFYVCPHHAQNMRECTDPAKSPRAPTPPEHTLNLTVVARWGLHRVALDLVDAQERLLAPTTYFNITVRTATPRDRVELAAFRASRDANRAALRRVERWVAPDAAASAERFPNFSIPDEHLAVYDRDPGPGATYTDVLLYLARSLRKTPVRFLELGVSAGKTTWQLTQNLPAGSRIVGVDCEEINPLLAERYDAVGVRHEFAPSPEHTDLRKSTYSASRYRHAETGTSMSYLACNIEDERCWQQMQEEEAGGFNLILSDALHYGWAIHLEYAMMQHYGLFDQDEFVIVYDDIIGESMFAYFRFIWDDMRTRWPPGALHCALLRVNGWVGEHMPQDTVGVISTVPFLSMAPLFAETDVLFTATS